MSRETNQFGSIVTARDEELEQAFGGVTKVKTTAEYDKLMVQSHANLTRLNFTRARVEQLVVGAGRELTLQRGVDLGLSLPKREGGYSKKRIEAESYWIRIDPAIDVAGGEQVDWARMAPGRKQVGCVGLLGLNNSKMQCPSFALPAGALQVGGTCVGAAIGQETVTGQVRKSMLEQVPKKYRLTVLGSHGHRADTPSQAIGKTPICALCYATGGSFQNGSVQIEEVTRHAWVQGVLAAAGPAGLAAEISLAVQGLKEGGWHESAEADWAKYGKLFFRLHDSGDFFSEDYAEAWLEVARQHPDVVFWAPTRTWVVESWDKYWSKARIPENMMIRPSAYNFDDPAPYVPGLGPGSTSLFASDDNVAREDDTRALWNCRVYYLKGQSHECTNADAPDANGANSGQPHCRACWIRPDLTINYTAHLWFLVPMLLSLFA